MCVSLNPLDTELLKQKPFIKVSSQSNAPVISSITFSHHTDGASADVQTPLVFFKSGPSPGLATPFLFLLFGFYRPACLIVNNAFLTLPLAKKFTLL